MAGQADNRSFVAANLADRYESIGDNQNLHRKIVAPLAAPYNDKSITEFGYPKSLAIKIAQIYARRVRFCLHRRITSADFFIDV